MLWLAFGVTLCAAYVDKQFRALPEIRYPGYYLRFLESSSSDPEFVEYVARMNGTGEGDKTMRGELIHFNDFERGFSCAVPFQSSHDVMSASGLPGVPVLPLTDEKVIDEARQILVRELANTNHSFVDKIWYWTIDFDVGVWQSLPRFVKLEPDFSSLAFHARIGRADTAPGTNLQSAKPVVVEDQHMLRVDYPNGDLCGLTGEPRTARIYFHCDLNAMDDISVRTIDEPYACVYEFLIGLPSMCSIEEFASPQVEPVAIMCAYDEVETSASNSTTNEAGVAHEAKKDKLTDDMFESTNPGETAEPAVAGETTQAAEPTVVTEIIYHAAPAETAKTFQDFESMETADPIVVTKTIQASEPALTAEVIQAADPIEVFEPLEASENFVVTEVLGVADQVAAEATPGPGTDQAEEVNTDQSSGGNRVADIGGDERGDAASDEASESVAIPGSIQDLDDLTDTDNRDGTTNLETASSNSNGNVVDDNSGHIEHQEL